MATSVLQSKLYNNSGVRKCKLQKEFASYTEEQSVIPQ